MGSTWRTDALASRVNTFYPAPDPDVRRVAAAASPRRPFPGDAIIIGGQLFWTMAVAFVSPHDRRAERVPCEVVPPSPAG